MADGGNFTTDSFPTRALANTFHEDCVAGSSASSSMLHCCCAGARPLSPGAVTPAELMLQLLPQARTLPRFLNSVRLALVAAARWESDLTCSAVPSPQIPKARVIPVRSGGCTSF